MTEAPVINSSEDGRLRQRWDTIIVGTGVGGATLGHRLAAAGQQVLFCELGDAAPALRGAYPELADGRDGSVLSGADADLLRAAGRCHDVLIDAGGARPRSFVPFIGCGPGGSSALYGMALERFAPADFEPAAHAGPAEGAAVVEAWPFSYAELAPCYDAAETLFGVRGERDPLAPHLRQAPALATAPPLSSAGTELASFLTSRGLHPYRLPAACGYTPGCATCQGVLCPANCKNDAARVALQPALADGYATLLDRCRVLGLRAEGRRATGVTAEWRGQPLELHARRVVLAAGALQTPLILLRSGLGNGSGLVGRCLMRHFVDLYLVRPITGDDTPFDNRRKELACNDFYLEHGVKLGTLQSFGRLPPASILAGGLLDDVRAGAWRWTAPLVAAARPLLQPMLNDISSGWHTLATIAEDLPYLDHGVWPGSAGDATLHYTLRPEAHARIERLRKLMSGTLRGRRWRRIAQAANNQRIAHVCGTCRAGDDPRNSVVDRENRVHELDNVYIADASFFPSSGGTNPALTIAANALRMAQQMTA